MLSRTTRKAVLSCFRPTIEDEALAELRECEGRQFRQLLRWLDDGGLTLYLLERLQAANRLHEVGPKLGDELMIRREANRLRTAGMMTEFAAVIDVLERSGIRYAVSKGFGAAPDFCSHTEFRHHSDIDLLVHQSDCETATVGVAMLGFSLSRQSTSGEIIFDGKGGGVSNGLMRSYELKCHSKIEIHLEKVPPLTIRKQVGEIEFNVLPLAWQFANHVIHASDHLRLGWVRPSWLVEIAYFISKHKNDEALWLAVSKQWLTKEIRSAMLILMLVQQEFGIDVPVPLQQEPSAAVQAWLRSCGSSFVSAGCKGTKLNVLLADELGVEDGDFGATVFPIKKVLHPFSMQRVLIKGLLRAAPELISKSFQHGVQTFGYFYYRWLWRAEVARLVASQR
jgi:Uncharacterised nucleotidyltransferase